MSNVHVLPLAGLPEYLLPLLNVPVGGPINGSRGHDTPCDFEKLLADQRTAWDWAVANRLAVLSANADRNGAYLVLAPSPRLHTLFGEERSCVHQSVQNGMRIELWVGSIEHIRVFWREVSCVH